jgi:hypothetical protein
VEEYSNLKLSKDLDRLPALSGIANQFRQYRQCRYLTGLWEDTLFEDLCWVSSHQETSKPAENRGPSWSWVAVNGPIYFPGNDELAIMTATTASGHKYCQITKLPDEEPMQADAKDCSIGLLAWLVPAVLLAPRTDASSVSGVPNQQYHVEASKITAHSFTADHVLSGDVIGKDNCFCLRIMSNDLEEYALVVKCVDPVNSVFKRIGLAHWEIGEQKPHEAEWHSTGWNQTITLI